MRNIYSYSSSIGRIVICEQDGFITHLFLNKDVNIEGYQIFESPEIKRAYQQLEEYFIGSRKKFDLNLKPKGTKFQRNVWKILLTISYGEVMTYKEVAQKMDNNKAYRAVGNANHQNPIPIIIPCHRVISVHQKLGGNALGIEMKKFLLNLEKNV